MTSLTREQNYRKQAEGGRFCFLVIKDSQIVASCSFTWFHFPPEGTSTQIKEWMRKWVSWLGHGLNPCVPHVLKRPADGAAQCAEGRWSLLPCCGQSLWCLLIADKEIQMISFRHRGTNLLMQEEFPTFHPSISSTVSLSVVVTLLHYSWGCWAWV